MARRPDGALEHDVLEVLWLADGPLLPADVRERLGERLAYTSVATVLSRLFAKGLIERRPVGRAFVYWPVIDESQLAAQRIDDLLDGASDRSKVLARFVGGLSSRDARLLRQLLDGDGS